MVMNSVDGVMNSVDGVLSNLVLSAVLSELPTRESGTEMS